MWVDIPYMDGMGKVIFCRIARQLTRTRGTFLLEDRNLFLTINFDKIVLHRRRNASQMWNSIGMKVNMLKNVGHGSPFELESAIYPVEA